MIKIFTVFLLITITASCAQKILLQNYLYYEYEDMQPADYKKEVERLNNVVQASRNDSELANAHLQLALLYSDYRNPAHDYNTALKELDSFASLDPEGSRRAYFQNWLRMLKEIEKADRSNEDLKEKEQQLNKELSRLEKENAEIKKKLEQLKHLDIEMEEKRKMVK
jgi:valyl-tRNA synthetase